MRFGFDSKRIFRRYCMARAQSYYEMGYPEMGDKMLSSMRNPCPDQDIMDANKAFLHGYVFEYEGWTEEDSEILRLRALKYPPKFRSFYLTSLNL